MVALVPGRGFRCGRSLQTHPKGNKVCWRLTVLRSSVYAGWFGGESTWDGSQVSAHFTQCHVSVAFWICLCLSSQGQASLRGPTLGEWQELPSVGVGVWETPVLAAGTAVLCGLVCTSLCVGCWAWNGASGPARFELSIALYPPHPLGLPTHHVESADSFHHLERARGTHG